MNALLIRALAASRNRHVSIPVGGAMLCELGKIWLPHYMVQWSATQKLLLGYGIIAAGNSGPGKPPADNQPGNPVLT